MPLTCIRTVCGKYDAEQVDFNQTGTVAEVDSTGPVWAVTMRPKRLGTTPPLIMQGVPGCGLCESNCFAPRNSLIADLVGKKWDIFRLDIFIELND